MQILPPNPPTEEKVVISRVLRATCDNIEFERLVKAGEEIELPDGVIVRGEKLEGGKITGKPLNFEII